MGGVTLFNDLIVHNRALPQEAKVVVATGIAAGGFVLLERISPDFAVGLAWLAFTAVLLVRTNPSTPAPVESFLAWYKG
jgi:hypothetical protein